MKKKIFIGGMCGLCLLATLSAHAQNPVWTLPNKFLVNYLLLPLPTQAPSGGYDGSPSTAFHAAWPDENDKPLFFIVENRVYDAEGFLLDELFTYNYPVFGHSELLILPNPGNCKQFYIFSSFQENIDEFVLPVYGILDLSQSSLHTPGRMGRMVEFSPSVNMKNFLPSWYNLHYRALIGYSAEQSNNGFNLYMFDGLSTIFIYELNSSGLFLQNSINLYYNISSTIFNNFESIFTIHEFESRRLTNGNTRLAGALTVNNGQQILFIIELDNLNNYISGSLRYKLYQNSVANGQIIKPLITGMEFSKNGNYLYVTHLTNSFHPEPIEYYEYSTMSNNVLNVTGKNDFKSSYIEIRDDSLYFITHNRIALLRNTNVPSNANWSNNEIPFNGFSYPSVGFDSKFILPDQIDYFDYGSLYSTSVCCKAYRYFHQTNYTVPLSAHNQVWQPGSNGFTATNDNVIYLNGYVRIPPGVTLTLKNFTLKFNDTSYVEIARGVNASSPGGKLILENCTLTADDRCGLDTTWKGVQVLGYPTALQNPVLSSSQGALVMRNSVIEKAVVGAYATRLYTHPSATLSPNDKFNGGIIQATNSTFLNNKVDVWFRKHELTNPNNGNIINNLSVFNNCNFITNRKLTPLFNNLPIANTLVLNLLHALVQETNGIRFRGCDFRNDAPWDYSISTRGMGIWGYDSRITAEGICSNLLCNGNVDSTRFVNLSFGVAVGNFNAAKNTVIERCVFDNVWRAATLRQSNTSRIVRNRFAITQYVLSPTTNSYGLFLNTCTGYQVEENLFHHYVDPLIPGAVENTYGIVVQNSGELPNQIYRNQFYNLYVGGQAQKVNAEPFTSNYAQPKGLQWLCNQFNSTITYADLITASGRIAYLQGACPIQNKMPAGNRFSHDNIDFAGSTLIDFSSLYHHHSDLITTPLVYDPLAINNPVDCNINFTSNYCTSKLGGGISELSQLLQNQQALTQQWQTERNKIDGGNTLALLQAIQSASNTTQLRNLLLPHAPFLSQAVLLAYLDKPGVPAGHYQQVLLANSPLPEAVKQAVQQKNLPQGIKNQILAAQQGISPVENQLQYVSYLHSEKVENLKQIMLLYATDTLGYRLNEMIALLENEPENEYLRELGYLYLEKQDSIKLFALLSSMEDDESQAAYVRWLQLLWSIRKADASCKAVSEDAGKKATLEELAYEPGVNGTMDCTGPQNLLMQMLEALFMEEVEMVYVSPQPRLSNAAAEDEALMPFARQIAYPNPTKEDLYINLPALEEGEVYHIQLINLNGQIVMEQPYQYGGLYHWQLDNVPAGIYLLQVRINGQLWMGQKVIKLGN